MPDIEFDDFIKGLFNTLAKVKARLKTQKHSYLVQHLEANKNEDIDGFNVYLDKNVNGVNSIKFQTIHIPFLTLRSFRVMDLSEFALDIPVTVESFDQGKNKTDQRLCFVLQTKKESYNHKKHPLKIIWRVDQENILDVKLNETSIFNFQNSLKAT